MKDKTMTKTVSAILASLLLLSSCQPSVHPNAINDFDGKTFDSLLLAHGALVTLREQIRTKERGFVPAFNSTAHAYSAAYDAYVVYRQAPLTNASQVSSLVATLASSIGVLSHDLTSPLPAPPEKVAAIKTKEASQRRLAASRPRYQMSLADIFTALQTGAEIAKTIPVTSPYASLAELVINAAQTAFSGSKAASGSPIDLALIAPVATI